MKDISVIIVTWNSADDIKQCIESVIAALKNISSEVIIVDNNSADETAEIINNISSPLIQFHKNTENLGYTKAVNQAYNSASGEFILLLNPDTVLMDDSIEKMMSFLKENSDYGACAPLLLNEDGTTQYSVRSFPTYWRMFCEFSLLAYIFPKTELFGSWKIKYFDYTKDSNIQQPMAAALMLRKSDLKTSDIMDKRFEMFFNDVDLCKSIVSSGRKIRLLTGSRIIHGHGKSINKNRIRMVKIWDDDCYEYFKKHHNNTFLLLWLKINLKLSEIIRILYYKFTGK